MLLFLPSATPALGVASSDSLLVSMDKTLFISTIPSYAVLGHNYTVRVLVTNHSNQSVPIILRIDGPLDLVYTYPIFVQVAVEPGHQLLSNFSLIAFATSTQTINVTAKLWVWFFDKTPAPVLVQQVSATINGVRSPAYSRIILAGVVVLIALPIVVISIKRLRRGQPGKRPEWDFE